GYWRSEAGRFEEAEAAYRSAIEFDPAFIEGWVNLGLFLINRGRFEEAERTLEEAMNNAQPDSKHHGRIITLLSRLRGE
ncbi:MAG: tetratricopeptide repeat protein, partial [Thermoplasmata archaeon]